MRRIAVVLLALAGIALAQRNTDGWKDTLSITDTLKTTTKYTRAMSITDGEDVRVLCKADDTASTGFSTDSLMFRWGYQLGLLTQNSTPAKDTIWSVRTVLDTLSVDSLGKDTVNVTAAAGTITSYWLKHADTTDVSGYAVQDRWFVPEWGELIRFWAQGLTGQREGAAIVLIFELHQRQYVPTGR
jgi:hypothetical protein